jgi:hypothetical protein
MRRVKCISGTIGWQDKLQKVYGSLDEFREFANFYGIYKRLGFVSVKDAWDANPVIQGSTNPIDFRCVELIKEAKRIKKQYEKETGNKDFDLADFIDQLKFNAKGKIIKK